ncbi:hypothetical protein OK016_24635 [Vibrio chagasii]|nr:hypothetical protein [Vibrio chagasii]
MNCVRDKTVVLITHDLQTAVRWRITCMLLQGTPASAHSLSVPHVNTTVLVVSVPRLQQAILEQLERDYD